MRISVSRGETKWVAMCFKSRPLTHSAPFYAPVTGVCVNSNTHKCTVYNRAATYDHTVLIHIKSIIQENFNYILMTFITANIILK